jgi:hypothetical protein
MADEPDDDDDHGEDGPRERGSRFQRLGEQLTGLLDPEAAFRRGSGLITGVTQTTKEELVRIISAEVKNFLDKMDAADLLQQVIAGLVIDVNMQVRFSREGEGPAQPEVTRHDTKIRLQSDERGGRGEGEGRDGKPEGRPGGGKR